MYCDLTVDIANDATQRFKNDSYVVDSLARIIFLVRLPKFVIISFTAFMLYITAYKTEVDEPNIE